MSQITNTVLQKLSGSSMRYDIVPICYAGGAGGRFLASFISSARDGVAPSGKLSPHGNAHDIVCDPGFNKGAIYNQDLLLAGYLQFNQKIEERVKYPPLHLVDQEKIKRNFAKSIFICADIDDLWPIMIAFKLKYQIDVSGKSESDINSHREYIEMVEQYKYLFMRKDYENICYISWKELVSGDRQILIEKLSTYTGIPEQQFNINFLEEWRTRTLEIISQYPYPYLASTIELMAKSFIDSQP